MRVCNTKVMLGNVLEVQINLWDCYVILVLQVSNPAEETPLNFGICVIIGVIIGVVIGMIICVVIHLKCTVLANKGKINREIRNCLQLFSFVYVALYFPPFIESGADCLVFMHLLFLYFPCSSIHHAKAYLDS